jgi:hypothetical protein
MYRCPPDFSDGESIDYSTAAESSEEAFSELLRTGERFDLVFVDPWHTYASSQRDLIFGLQLVNRDGIVMVHDCNPPNLDCADPEYHPGEWCGVTFAAFLDLVLFADDLHYATVDCDYGCGIISRQPQLASLLRTGPNSELTSRWRVLDLKNKYSFFDEHRSELLRLTSTEEFCLRLAEGSQCGQEVLKGALQMTGSATSVPSSSTAPEAIESLPW